MPWYTYNPSGSAPYSISDPNFYTNVGGTPPDCPNANNYLCAIQADDSGGKPVFTTPLALEMAFALNNRIDTTNVRLRPTVL